MFLKNREIRVKLSKTPKDENHKPTIEEHIGEAAGELVNEIAKDILKRAAIAVSVVIVAYKAVDTISQIAIKKTKSADNQ